MIHKYDGNKENTYLLLKETHMVEVAMTIVKGVLLIIIGSYDSQND